MYLILELSNLNPNIILIDTYIYTLDHLLLYDLPVVSFF